MTIHLRQKPVKLTHIFADNNIPAHNNYNGFGQLAFPKYREGSWFCIWDDLLRLFTISGAKSENGA